MTFQKMLEDLSSSLSKTNQLSNVKSFLEDKEHRRTINYFVHHDDITKEPLTDSELSQLQAIVELLQILYNSEIGSPISDQDYDVLQEMLVNMGIPRLTGTVEINDASKASHQYKTLRGTLDKVYYLSKDDVSTNKSRKYLDDWIKSAEAKYEKVTGKRINLNDEDVCLQCKMDGTSVVLEVGDQMRWLTRGDTRNNRATDVSHIMNIFNHLYSENKDCGIKFEVMCTEENKDKINELLADSPYKNSRQVVTSTLNSAEPDIKAEYLYPVPLRIIHKGESIEQIHPDYFEKFPFKICKLGDRDAIREFANQHRVANVNGMHFRTDGCVITILNKDVQKALGRENDINQYEVAYKFTEETAVSKIIGVEFEASMFGYITPVAVFYPVILKGNRVDHASLSTRERFDEMDLHIGDEVNVLYDIIPYVTKRSTGKGRKIDFVHFCPSCGHELDLTEIRVRCQNPKCRSRVLGRILNYCTNLRIQNIGSNTLEVLYQNGLLDHGIRSLYKLRKHEFEIQDLEGFGKLKTKKIINEIEAKRKLKDYEVFGSLGIASLSMKTFQTIFCKIQYDALIKLLFGEKFDQLYTMLMNVDGMAEAKTKLMIETFKDESFRHELKKLLKELDVKPTYVDGSSVHKGTIVFTGFRSPVWEDRLEKVGWIITNSISRKTSYLIADQPDGTSSKIQKAHALNIPILGKDQLDQLVGGV